jgi:hypothetical protein
MTSLTASSSVALPPFRSSLAHSLNSRGELGMFVNPYGCSCETCVDYIADRSSSAAEVALGPSETNPSGALEPAEANPSWALGTGAGSFLGLGMGCALGPSSSVMEGWGGEERPLFGADLRAAPALGRTVTGLGYTPTVPEAADESDEEATFQEETMNRLRTVLERVQARQDAVYDGETRSHDEMAAQDAEWEELDRQIHAIEEVLCLFNREE